MDGPIGYYTKWNVRQGKTNAIWFYLYVESKTKIWAHRYRVYVGGSQGQEVGGGWTGEGGQKVL